jgi:hypothetical protein
MNGAVPKANDTEYQEGQIASVEWREEDEMKGYITKMNGGLTIFVPDKGIEPKPGMIVRMYGKGVGFPIRGLDVDGKEIYYNTAAEYEAEMQKKAKERKEQQKQEYESKRSSFEDRVGKLPQVFQKRFQDFREFKGDEFRYSFEAYELFVCEEAVLIAETLGLLEKIKEFASADTPKRQEMVPGIRMPEHSNNTFVQAIQLACSYIMTPERITQMHGALCQLVGCDIYGCYASRCEDSEQEGKPDDKPPGIRPFIITEPQ